jgi:HEAT repeat protein
MVTDNDLLVRIRAADAAEKITAEHPEYLQPFKRLLLHEAARSDLPEVRWHVAQMIPRLGLSRTERQAACAILRVYLRDRSRIVRTCAMQALADLAEGDSHLRPSVWRTIKVLTATGSPAMKSRGRKLLAKLASRAS